MAKAIRVARAEKQLSQSEVAARAGTSPVTISELESAKADPKLSTLARIVGALDLTIVTIHADVARGTIGGDVAA